MAETETAQTDPQADPPEGAEPQDDQDVPRDESPVEIDVSDTDGGSGRRKAPKIEKYFRAAVKMSGSDLHFKAGVQPRLRVRGKLRAIAGKPLTNEKIERMIFQIMTEEQKQAFARNGAADFAYQLDESDRFRVNVFRQRGRTSLCARRVSRDILNFDQLHLPKSMYKLAEFHQGLVLLAGITGSGKSTTIAATLDYINAHRSCHIVTLEDPIEYLFEDRKAVINQREIGIDVPDFHAALKHLMREDPDVVLIGEMRDAETFQAALHAAETGHLVFGTVHASGAAQTITRVLDLLPESSRDLIRQTLVFNLQAVVCQKLLRSIKKGVPRIPCVEIMLSNPVVRKLIAEEREDEIPDLLKASYDEGMMDFNHSLHTLMEQEFISLTDALASSPNPDELRMRLKGIRAGGSGLLG